MTGVKGDFGKLSGLKQRLQALPTVVAQQVAARAVGKINELANGTFNAGENAYGDRWAPGEKGQKVTLTRTGRMKRGVRYVAIGTKLRAALATSYAKYQVGKRPVFPRQGARLPVAYVNALRETTAEVVPAQLGAR